MGNKNSKLKTNSKKPQKNKPDNVPPISDQSVNILKNKYLTYVDLTVALQSAQLCNKINKPFIIILSFNTNNKVFDETDIDHQKRNEILKTEEKEQLCNYSIINNKTHRDAKNQITNIIKQHVFKKPFDGVVVILLCVVRLHEDKAGEGHVFKFYYDIERKKRHVDKLNKDVVYRLEDDQDNVYIHYEDDEDGPTVIDFSDESGQRPAPKNAVYVKDIPALRAKEKRKKLERVNKRKGKKKKKKKLKISMQDMQFALLVCGYCRISTTKFNIEVASCVLLYYLGNKKHKLLVEKIYSCCARI